MVGMRGFAVSHFTPLCFTLKVYFNTLLYWASIEDVNGTKCSEAKNRLKSSDLVGKWKSRNVKVTLLKVTE